MKRKQKRNSLLKKIAKVSDKHDKLTLAISGLTAKERYSHCWVLAKDLWGLRKIDPKELQERTDREIKAGNLSVKTECEYINLRALQNRLRRFLSMAAFGWKPEMLEQLAKAMKCYGKHKSPQPGVKFLVANDGDVNAALATMQRFDPSLKPNTNRWDREKRNLYRQKKILFPAK